MKLQAPKNSNYCATVVTITNIIPLENCDNIVSTNIFGNNVIVGKNIKIGDIGLFFPVETQLSENFLKNNNLYHKPELNIDNTKKGFFELNRRIKCQRFRGNKSMGFFIPLTSLDYLNIKLDLKEGDSFDEINGIEICRKYFIQIKNSKAYDLDRNKNLVKKFNVLLDGQFRLHYDTEQLAKHIKEFKETDCIHISNKWHGTSFVSSNILTKRRVNIFEKFLKILKFNIKDTEYRNIYSSRKMIKNAEINLSKVDYYDVDIWRIVNDEIKDRIPKGYTLYGEIVGYLPNGDFIQKDYDYDCQRGEHKVLIYRITITNENGIVYELSAKEVQKWCINNGLIPVKELYYGTVIDLYNKFSISEEKFDYTAFLELLTKIYLDKYVDCNICCKVPDEGIVIRNERTNEAFKLKSFLFLEKETKDLDKGENNIEDNQ